VEGKEIRRPALHLLKGFVVHVVADRGRTRQAMQHQRNTLLPRAIIFALVLLGALAPMEGSVAQSKRARMAYQCDARHPA